MIELLIVIGIIGILAAIILVAVDPARRLRQARNARRSAEVNAVLNAILNYTVDNRGTLPSGITATSSGIVLVLGSSTAAVSSTACPNSLTGAGTSTSTVDLSNDLVDSYIAEMPIDPRGSNGTDTYSASNTGYYVKRTTNGRVEVGSCNPEADNGVTTAIKIKR